MSKLLRADFLQMRKNRVFWLGVILMVVYALSTIYIDYRNMQDGMAVSVDQIFFVHITWVGAFVIIFTTLFVGTEYSDGTIRNKLMIGHSRISIYLANLITSVTASVIMLLAHTVVSLAVGIPVLGTFRVGPSEIVQFYFLMLLMTAAFAAVAVLFSMLNQNRAAAAVICITGFFLLLFSSLYVNARLSEPKMYDSYVYEDDAGELVSVRSQRNPNYLDGTGRIIFQFLSDFLPTGQSLQIAQENMEHKSQMAVSSVGIILVVILGGMTAFQRKDLK